MKNYFIYMVIFITSSFFIISCSQKTQAEKTLILQPICKPQKEYELLKDPIFDYPITYKVKKKKCIIEYEKKMYLYR